MIRTGLCDKSNSDMWALWSLVLPYLNTKGGMMVVFLGMLSAVALAFQVTSIRRLMAKLNRIATWFQNNLGTDKKKKRKVKKIQEKHHRSAKILSQNTPAAKEAGGKKHQQKGSGSTLAEENCHKKSRPCVASQCRNTITLYMQKHTCMSQKFQSYQL